MCKGGASFEIESEYDHFRPCFQQRSGDIHALRIISQVGTPTLQHVGQSEAESDLRVEFEVGQIEVASKPHGQVYVGGLEFDEIIAFFATSTAGMIPAVIYSRELR